jgi:chemotaxis signal transduction protein
MSDGIMSGSALNERIQPDQCSFVVFQMDGRRFALPAGDVVELAPPVRLHTFPHATPLLKGVIVRRGHIVPVYDQAVLAARSPSTHRFYLIGRCGSGETSEFAAIPVAGECELVAGELQAELPARVSRPAYISGTLAIGGDSIDVLDLEKLVAPATAEGGAGTEVPS